jgi:GH25 family lysozyme M1 (1,4-beta-N-acetylmuramidase)
MSADYRHSGVGWPTGAVDNAAVFALPSPNLLMLSTEGRYHYDEAVRAGKRCLWRAVPRIGKRPAELKWSPTRFMAEALNLTNEPTLPIRDFVFANELDLNSERGDGEDDWSNLENRYALIGGWAFSLIPMLRQALPGTRLHWPAWTPDHQSLDYGHLWRPAADLTDCVDFHAYDSLMNIAGQYSLYRSEFPDKPLCLTEWHCKGDLDEERRVLHWMAEMMAVDPLFEAAYFFIYRWHDHPGWWDDSWDIEHTPARLALFRDPPLAAITVPPPVVVPDPPPPEEPPMPDYPLGIDVSNNNGAIDWPAVAADGVSFAAAKITEGTGFRDGLFQPNWDGMQAERLIRIAYHFGRPDRNRGDAGAIAEANYMVDAFGLLGTTIEAGDCLALDQEQPGISGDYSGWTWAWVQQIADRVGFLPLIYLAPEVIQRMQLYREPRLGQCGLWLASWGVPTPPPAPAPWDLVAIHQTGVGPAGTIPGISGEIDLNRFNGPDVATLRLYGKPASTGPSEPPTSTFSVGPGILAAMAASADDPATDEIGSATGQYAEAWGTSGAHYVYLKLTNRTYRYDPAA